MNHVGKRKPMADAREKVTGATIYTDDMFFPRMLYGKILYSPVPHGKIISIDTSAAEALEGVAGVVTHKDSPDVRYNSIMRSIDDEFPKTMRVLDDTVRFVGDSVAAVAAESEEIAARALKLINVEYEVYPAVYEPEEALAPGAFEIHPGGNLIQEFRVAAGDAEEGFNQSDLIVESVVSTPRIHHASIETFVVTAHWSVDNKLTVWTPNHSACGAMFILSNIFEVPCSHIRIIRTPIGGSFGGKTHVVLEPIALLLAKKAGRHVRIRLDRKETMVSTNTRHAYKIYSRTGVRKDGTLLAHTMKAYLNAGPHCRTSTGLVGAMFGKIPKIYRVPNLLLEGYPTYTNGPLGGAMRGFGSPAGFLAFEVQIEKIARQLGIDSVELRRKNLVHPHDREPVHNVDIGNARILDCLNKGAELFNWNDREKRRNNSDRYRFGFGVGVGLHGNGVFPIFPDMTSMTINLQEDGSIKLNTGLCDVGAGSYTIIPQIVAEILDMDPDTITIADNDTAHGLYDYGASASRNTWVGGMAAIELAGRIREKLIVFAAEMMETDTDSVSLDQGKFLDTRGRQSVSRKEVILHAFRKHKVRFTESIDYASKANAGSYGAHFAEVRVDITTGEVAVLNYVAVCDVGKALNPMLLEGQIEGGIHMGLGFALTEELKVDPESGRVTNAGFKKYRLVKAGEMPKVTIAFIEEKEDCGPFGAKSIGEAALVPVAPAVVNAVNDALGTEMTDLPLTPDKIVGRLGENDLQNKGRTGT
jgi:CO/xanthine dehydrogenase Mo-binding subunit